ncbi:hypothetical protein E2C01_088509 [Portunus trituberculatus]|uniref:Uncharacterized protein n=1 Tax=Portunus trituberculatus TaxID=210409 RepID=A0A5B7JG69_PORTR|nr:hypothetical protein [Portunus trituberculatus]
MECPLIAKFRPQGQHDLYSFIDHLLGSATLRDILREYPVGCLSNKELPIQRPERSRSTCSINMKIKFIILEFRGTLMLE